MTEPKSIEQIVDAIDKKIKMMMMEQLPVPSCPLKRQQREWKIEQVKKILQERLSK